jgi:hypothetical protein
VIAALGTVVRVERSERFGGGVGGVRGSVG